MNETNNINILIGYYATRQISQLELFKKLKAIGFSNEIIAIFLDMAYDQKRRNDERTQANTEGV